MVSHCSLIHILQITEVIVHGILGGGGRQSYYLFHELVTYSLTLFPTALSSYRYVGTPNIIVYFDFIVYKILYM